MADLERSSVEIDARNLMCPMPVIRTQNSVESLPHGTRVIVYSTDPGALNDIPAWTRIHGHKLIETREEGEDFVVELEVQKQD